MDLPDPKYISKLIDLCRKKGVESVEVAGIKLTLREEVPKPPRKSSSSPLAQHTFTDPATDPEAFDQLTLEEKLFYSSTGHMPNDPKEGVST